MDKNEREPFELVIITGLSGAGKSQAIHYFEDAGFFCIDNLPPALLAKFILLCREAQGRVSRVAVVIDIRGGAFFGSFFDMLQELKTLEIDKRIMFLEASDEVLIRRFSETRRKHPLSSGGRIVEDINYERKKLAKVREHADLIINTTDMIGRDLYTEMRNIIDRTVSVRQMSLVFISFGFKHGIPLDCDMVFDVRFLPNPYYIPELKAFSGLDQQIADFVLGSEMGAEFSDRLADFIVFLLPQFLHEPKSRVQVGIGCTGGRHRSVALAEFLYRTVKHDNVSVSRRHRDLELR